MTRGNVVAPYPGRKLKHVVSAPVPGRRFCRHRYEYKGYHEERDGGLRFAIRHYECVKCSRMVHVYGPGDDREIRRTLERKQKG